MDLRNDDSVVMSTSYLQFTRTVERFSQHNNYPLIVLLFYDPGVEKLSGGLLSQGSGPASFIELHIINHITMVIQRTVIHDTQSLQRS